MTRTLKRDSCRFSIQALFFLLLTERFLSFQATTVNARYAIGRRAPFIRASNANKQSRKVKQNRRAPLLNYTLDRLN